MRFLETPLPGAFVIELERHSDGRGYFTRTWCRKEFETHGLAGDFPQANLSLSEEAGTIRGMHYQEPPYTEAKLVRCLRGALHDVIIDLRPESTTFGRHYGVDLSEEDYRALYVPAGFAHGFQTHVDRTEAHYMVSEFYTPAAERGVRFDDPAFGIRWPHAVSRISEKDKNWPLFGGDLRLRTGHRDGPPNAAQGPRL